MLLRVVLLVGAVSAVAASQAPFPVEQIDEWRYDFGDETKTADWGVAVAHAEDDGGLRVEGRDDSGERWLIRLDTAYGATARVRVFAADLDVNGRRDLLIASNTVANGRCIDGGEIVVLLFGATGRPSPWRHESHGFLNEPPITLLDLDRNGRAEIGTTGCEYLQEIDGRSAMAELRTVSGVFEAGDGRWLAVAPQRLAPYLDAVRKPFERDQGVVWEPVDLNAPIASDPGPLRVAGLRHARFGCVVELDETGEEIRECEYYPAVLYSDGEVRRGWPAAWFGDTGDFRGEEAAIGLRSLLTEGIDVRLSPPFDEPTVLLVDRALPRIDLDLRRRFKVDQVRRERIESLHEFPPRGGSLYFAAERFATTVDGTPAGFSTRRIAAGSDAKRHGSRENGPGKTWLARSGGCVEARGRYALTSADAPQIVTAGGCESLGAMGSVAEAAGALSCFGPQPEAELVFPGEAKLQFIAVTDGAIGEEIVFERPDGGQGDLVAVVGFHDGRMLQWEHAGRTWLSLADDKGAARGGRIELEQPIDGYLIDVRSDDGLIFLRWEGGRPVERITVVGSIEELRR